MKSYDFKAELYKEAITKHITRLISYLSELHIVISKQSSYALFISQIIEPFISAIPSVVRSSHGNHLRGNFFVTAFFATFSHTAYSYASSDGVAQSE